MDGSPFGFGMMQHGGSYGGPLGMQRARDPRYAYANALMRGGADTSPVHSNLQGLARVGTGLAGAWLARDAGKDWDNRESNRALAISNALKEIAGTPGETKTYGDGTTINWGERKPNFQGAISGLSQNPDTADMALGLQMQQVQAAQSAQAALQKELLSKGLRISASGQVEPIPGYGAGIGANKAGEARPQIAVEVERQGALAPGAVRQAVDTAVGTAAGTAPIDVRKALDTAAGLSPIQVRTAGQSEGARLAAQNAPTTFTPPGASAPVTVPAASVASVGTKGAETQAEKPTQVAGVERKWRQELEKPLAAAGELANQNKIIQTALAKGDGTGDIAAITSFNKMLDPGAVVREADVTLTLAAQGIADKLAIWMENKKSGDILPPDLRVRMGELAKQIYDTSGGVLRDRILPYRAGIEKEGGNFDLVVPPQIRQLYGWDAPPAQGSAPRPVGSAADYDALPSGTVFTAPDGSVRTKP